MTPVILTDIEGTTSSVSFVHDVLFPYAAEHLEDWVQRHALEPRVVALLDNTLHLAARPFASRRDAVSILLQWIAEDRKATPLKTLQGWIWAEGFASGAFESHMYVDAAEQLQAWHAAGTRLFVYSSGSIGAQRLYFRHTVAGDLLPLFEGHFDTSTGPKKEADSYRTIASAIGVPAASIVFLSDVTAELDAAEAAGMSTVHVVRETMDTTHHRVAKDFHDVESYL